MLTLLFVILMLLVVGKLIWAAVKLSWGIALVIPFLFLFPLIMIGLAVVGCFFIAIPLLVIVGIGSLFFRPL